MPARRRARLLAVSLLLAGVVLAAIFWFRADPESSSRAGEQPTPGAPVAAANDDLVPAAPTPKPASSGSLQGLVVTPTGEPVPGAEVSVQPVGSRVPVLRALTTDAAGRFVALHLSDGLYTVVASKGGLISDRVDGAVGAGVPEKTLRLTLEAGATLAGTVRDADDGSALSNCQITTSFGQSIGCDYAGRFVVGPLAPGDIPMRVSAPGYAPRDVTVTLTKRARASADVTLTKGAAVTGTVLDPDHKPFAGALVRTSHYALDGVAPAEVQATSDRQGHFVLEGIAPGRVAFQATAAGYAETPGVELRLVGGERHEGLELTLTTGGAIAGQVLSGGRGVEGARVESIRLKDKAVVATSLSGADGAYRLDGLAEGDYTIVATSSSSRGVSPNTHVTGRDETTVNVTLGEEAISGRVIDTSGKPVPGAMVTVVSSLSSGQGAQATSVDGEGRFHVEGLIGAPYRVQARAEGHGSVELRGVAANAQVELVLSGAGRIEGVVTDRRGRSLESFEVRLLPRDTSLTGSVAGRMQTKRLVSPDGSFRFDEVPAGTYAVRATAGGHVPDEESVEVAAGSTAHVSLGLGDGLTITGRILQDGAPVANCEVNPGPNAAASDASGEFRLSGVETDGGRVFVWARCPDGTIASGLATVDGDRGEVTLQAKPSRDHRLDRQNSDFGGVGIQLRQQDGQIIAAWVMEGGPGFTAGVQNGDVITTVDGWPTTGAAINDVVNRIRGPLGMPVALGIFRPATGTSFIAYAERARIATD